MTAGEAAQHLSLISNATVRDYSTYDFGRSRDTSAKSVVVPRDRSRQVLGDIRKELGRGLVAFIGTTQWLGDEVHRDEEEIVVASGRDQFDILRIARSDAVNYDMLTEDLVKKLKGYHKDYGIDIFHAETDTIEFNLKSMPKDLSAFCKDLYKFCPDIVDQGTDTVERLEDEIRKNGEVFLWWD